MLYTCVYNKNPVIFFVFVLKESWKILTEKQLI